MSSKLPEDLRAEAGAIEAHAANLDRQGKAWQEIESRFLVSEDEAERLAARAMTHGLKDPLVDGADSTTYRQAVRILDRAGWNSAWRLASFATEAAEHRRKAEALRSRIPSDAEIRSAAEEVEKHLSVARGVDDELRQRWAALESALELADIAFRRIAELQTLARQAQAQAQVEGAGYLAVEAVPIYHARDTGTGGRLGHELIVRRANMIARGANSTGTMATEQTLEAIDETERILAAA